MSLPVEIHDAFRLYVDTVSELEESSLSQNLLKSGKITYRFSMREGMPINQEIVDLDEEHLKAFILTGRLLAQDNERCSIRNLSKIFDSFLTAHPLWPRFNGIRWKLNEFLDQPTVTPVEGHPEMTSREVFDVFLYGHYAHRNRDKEVIYKRWEASTLTFPYLKLSFLMSLSVLFACAHQIKEVLINILNE